MKIKKNTDCNFVSNYGGHVFKIVFVIKIRMFLGVPLPPGSYFFLVEKQVDRFLGIVVTISVRLVTVDGTPYLT